MTSTALPHTPQVWSIIGPGGRLHPSWFLEHKGHLVVEGLLIVILAVMLLQSRFSPKATEDEEGLTEKVCSCSSGSRAWPRGPSGITQTGSCFVTPQRSSQ